MTQSGLYSNRRKPLLSRQFGAYFVPLLLPASLAAQLETNEGKLKEWSPKMAAATALKRSVPKQLERCEVIGSEIEKAAHEHTEQSPSQPSAAVCCNNLCAPGFDL